jgi:hypothetical protein
MERFRFYRAILPYLVLIGTVIAPPFGGQYGHGYIRDFANVQMFLMVMHVLSIGPLSRITFITDSGLGFSF